MESIVYIITTVQLIFYSFLVLALIYHKAMSYFTKKSEANIQKKEGYVPKKPVKVLERLGYLNINIYEMKKEIQKYFLNHMLSQDVKDEERRKELINNYENPDCDKNSYVEYFTKFRQFDLLKDEMFLTILVQAGFENIRTDDLLNPESEFYAFYDLCKELNEYCIGKNKYWKDCTVNELEKIVQSNKSFKFLENQINKMNSRAIILSKYLNDKKSDRLVKVLTNEELQKLRRVSQKKHNQ